MRAGFLIRCMLPLAAALLSGQEPTASPRRPLPDFDARGASPRAGAVTGASPAAVRSIENRLRTVESFMELERLANPGSRIVSGRFGLPKSFLRDGGVLTPPTAADPEIVARSFLRGRSGLFPFSPDEVDNLRLAARDVNADGSYLTVVQMPEAWTYLKGKSSLSSALAGSW